MVIVLTAVTSSVTTVAVTRWWSADPPPPPPPRPLVMPLPPPAPAPLPCVPRPVEATAPASCDEVSCLLDDYEPACCAAFDKRDHGGEFDAALVRGAVSRVKTSVLACGERSAAKGEVKVRVRVSPAGKIMETTVMRTPDATLGSCVAGAMKKLRFSRTTTGGTFTYPFRF